jgi:DNA polymerase V
MRVNSDAMVDHGICKGDVVIVDRSLEAAKGKIVIAVVDGELLIRKLEITEGKKRLIASKKVSSIDVSNQELNVWGVVTYIIHNV